MHSTTIIGWTADADVWCDDCATAAYGPDEDGRKDNEGNPVSPIFADYSSELLADNEHGRVLCGTCLETVIAEYCDHCEDPNHASGDHVLVAMLDHGWRDQWQETADRLSIARDLVSQDSVGRLAGLVLPNADLPSRTSLASAVHDMGYAAAELSIIAAEYDHWIRRREWLQHIERAGSLPATQNADGSPLTDYQRTLSETRFGTAEECLADEGCFDYLSESLDVINNALSTAGFLAYDDGDAGVWRILTAEGGIIRDYCQQVKP